MLSIISSTRFLFESKTGITTIALMLSGIPSFSSNRGKTAGFFTLKTSRLIIEITISEAGIITATAVKIM